MSSVPIGNSELISEVNSRLVLQAVRVMQPTYRAAVARETGLKPATVTSIVNQLIDRQMLTETAVPSEGRPSEGRWGRPPLMLEVNATAKRILAIDLEPQEIRVALTNLLVEVLVYRKQRIDRFSDPETVCAAILRLCDQVLAGVDRRQLLGVGVSLPGLIDREKGVLISSTNMPGWRNVKVAQVLQRSLRAEVQVERSVHLASLYQKWADPNHQDRTVITISVRTGIGMSLMHRGELYVGECGFDGEIGHTVVDLNGQRCECGGRGCLETFIGAPAICARARESIERGQCQALRERLEAGEPLSPELIYELAGAGDEGCAVIVRHIGKYLGIAIANMVNLLAPNEVVICGSIDAAGQILLPVVHEQMEHTVLPRMRERVTLRLAKEQEKLPLLGAAVQIAQEIFQLPRLRHGVPADLARPRATRIGRRRRPISV